MRVRYHGKIGRLELEPEEFARAVEPKIRSAVVQALGQAEFDLVCLDLSGFESGSMNASHAGGAS